MSNYIYELSENNEVRVWLKEDKESGNPPIFYQPHRPDGSAWESSDEAVNWALNIISIIES